MPFQGHTPRLRLRLHVPPEHAVGGPYLAAAWTARLDHLVPCYATVIAFLRSPTVLYPCSLSSPLLARSSSPPSTEPMCLRAVGLFYHAARLCCTCRHVSMPTPLPTSGLAAVGLHLCASHPAHHIAPSPQ